MRRQTLGLGALVAVTVVALAMPALAHHTDQVDPNGTDGKLDLEQVGFDHEGEAPSWRMVTFSTWTVRRTGIEGTSSCSSTRGAMPPITSRSSDPTAVG